MTTTAKVLYTGKTHVTSGPNGAARSSDGFVDIKLPEPHPAAEQLFAAAWSACYLGAIQLAAQQKKVKLASPPSVDTEIDLNNSAGAFFLRARLNVTVPGVDREVAQALIEAAHGICPYSKAVHGNIDVTTTLA
ncbi:peroxiredoxin [Bradyrhizobium guangdongense]|uniref:Ohr family peroxiredoxin n=1 Tax=Bradyrhizobium guangdongense TaxID=1325090 RepID=UPI00112D50DE|nr:Ohr family peroxiredoxin [Bradyrhizobium guangdongense]TPQ27801.1 peroxiredoxin [Bradyrhizobium guangdongense]